MSTAKLIMVKGTNKHLTSETMSYIDKIGCELEGGWYINPENLHTDESIRSINKVVETPQFIIGDDDDHDCHTCTPHVFTNGTENIPGITYCPDDCRDPNHCDDSCDNHCGCPFKQDGGVSVGECISPPLSIEELRDWIEREVPDKVNTSCGLHFHISLKNDSHYVRLAEKEFQDYLIDWLKRWATNLGIPKSHEFWNRLEGRNKYCMPTFQPELQMSLTTKFNRPGENPAIRRTILNYCYNFVKEDGTKRKTLECRVFPAFNHAGYIVSAMEAYVSCVETYLSLKKDSDLKSVQVLRSKAGMMRIVE